MGDAVDGRLALLHALEQARLGLGGGAVDLVGQHDVGEHRPGPELELGRLLVEDVHAGDVAGQQVRRELDAREAAVDRSGERLREERLADTGVVLDDDVAAGEQGDHAGPYHLVLAQHHGRHVGGDQLRTPHDGRNLVVLVGPRIRTLGRVSLLSGPAGELEGPVHCCSLITAEL